MPIGVKSRLHSKSRSRLKTCNRLGSPTVEGVPWQLVKSAEAPLSMTKQKQRFSRRLGNALLLIILLPVILPLALLALALYVPHRLALYMLIWLLWLPR